MSLSERYGLVHLPFFLGVAFMEGILPEKVGDG